MNKLNKQSVKLFILLTIFQTIFSAKAAYSAAWNQPADSSYFKISSRAIFGDQAFTVKNESPVDVDYYKDLQLSAYHEYGITSDITFIFKSIPIGYAVSGNKETSYSGLTSIGLRTSLNIPISNWVSAAEIRFGIEPGHGAKKLSNSLYTDQNEKTHSLTYQPAVKNKKTALEFQFGRSIEGGWIVMTAGYKVNTAKNLDNVFAASFQLGINDSTLFNRKFRHSYDLSINSPAGPIEEINISGAGQTNYIGLNIGLAFSVREFDSITFDFGSAPKAEANAFSPSLALGYESSFN